MINVLVVDDDEVILRIVEATLIKAGHSVVLARDGHQALEKCESESFGLIVSDINMPCGISGFQLVATLRVKDKYKNTPIMLLTGRRDKNDVVRAMKAGGDDYVVKPVDPDLLLAKVEALLHKKPGRHAFVDTPVRKSGTLEADIEIVGLSEQGMTLQTPVPLGPGLKLRFASPLFDEIGIEAPPSRVVRCVPVPHPTDLFQVHLAFVGLKPGELHSIRRWLLQNKHVNPKRAA